MKLSLQEKRYLFFFFLLGLALYIFLLPIKDRTLLYYDDMIFIYPLKDLSLYDYFFKWAKEKGHFPYPLRDFTFFLDFFLEKRISIPTFWIQNYLWFFLISLFSFKFFKLFFVKESKWPFALFLIFFLHPLSVENIEWAYNRKHLIAAFFTLLPTYLLFKAYREKTVTKKRVIMAYCLHLLSFLSISSSLLWGLYPLVLLKKEWEKYKKILILGTLIEILVIVAQAILYTDHFITTKSPLSLSFLTYGSEVYINALGRTFFNLLLPFQLVIYFILGHPFNELGLIFFLFLLSLLFFTRSKALLLFLWSLCLIFPSGIQMPYYNYFVWANRYILIGLPYLLLTISLLLYPYRKILHTYGKGLLFTLLGFYLVQDIRHILPWKTEVSLFNFCAETEGTAMCHLWSIMKMRDRQGWADALPLLERSKRQYHQIILQPKSYDFQLNIPFLEAQAIYFETTKTPNEKLLEIQKLISFYNERVPFLFTQSLLYLTQGDKQKAVTAILPLEFKYFEATQDIINSMAAAFLAYCELIPEIPSCFERYRTIEDQLKNKIVPSSNIFKFGKSEVFRIYEKIKDKER